MTDVTLYHNPRCSKSRQTLALLEEKGATIHEVRYLEEAPSKADFERLIRQLGLARAHEVLRTGEPEYKEAGLSKDSSDAEVIAALVRFPKLLERPIAVVGDKAVIGRPPENVLELL
jgi:arsenate reductase